MAQCVVEIWCSSRFKSYRKVLSFDTGSPESVSVLYKRNSPSYSEGRHANDLVWEPEVSLEAAKKLQEKIESASIRLTSSTSKYLSYSRLGLKYMSGTSTAQFEWEPGEACCQELDELWRHIDDVIPTPGNLSNGWD